VADFAAAAAGHQGMTLGQIRHEASFRNAPADILSLNYL
jgi:hypothetical protein